MCVCVYGNVVCVCVTKLCVKRVVRNKVWCEEVVCHKAVRVCAGCCLSKSRVLEGAKGLYGIELCDRFVGKKVVRGKTNGV